MRELEATMDADEVTEWAAYYQLDPFGSHRADLQAGIIASTMANIHAKKGHRFTPSDFMPKFGEPEPQPAMTTQQMQEFLAMRFGRTRRG